MAYPTPTIYTYRVKQVFPANYSHNDGLGYFLAEYSLNSGTTWLPLTELPFGSAIFALQAISDVVNNEANFQKQVTGGGYVPQVYNISYPAGT